MGAFTQGIALAGLALATAGAIKSASAQEDAAEAAARQSNDNSLEVLRVAEKNVEQVESNIRTIRESEVINRQQILISGSDARIKAESDRQGIRLQGEQAVRTAGQKRLAVNRDLEKSVSTARARGGAAGITSNTGSVQEVIAGFGFDAGIELSAIDLETRNSLEILEFRESQILLDLELELLEFQRNLAILDYNTKIDVQREERRIELIRLQAEVEGANFNADASRSRLAGDAASTATLTGIGSSVISTAGAFS